MFQSPTQFVHSACGGAGWHPLGGILHKSTGAAACGRECSPGRGKAHRNTVEASAKNERLHPGSPSGRCQWAHSPPGEGSPHSGKCADSPRQVPHETGQGAPPANADGAPVPSRLIREPGGSSGLHRQSPYGAWTPALFQLIEFGNFWCNDYTQP